MAENGELVQHTTVTIEGSDEPAAEEDALPASEQEEIANEDAGVDDAITNDPAAPETEPDNTPDPESSADEEKKDEDEEKNDLQ